MKVSDSDSVAENDRVVKSLTPTQRAIWQRLSACPAEARNSAGRIPITYLADALPGGTVTIGWDNLLYVHICHIRRRLAPLGIRIVGYDAKRDPSNVGGYLVALESERAA